MMRKKTIIIGGVLILLAYNLGVATGHYKLFPFNLLYNIKNDLGLKASKRNLDTTHLKEVQVKVTDETGIYLTYGQSNSVNEGQIGYEVKHEVFQFLDNRAYIYKDPSLGGTGKGGSVWGMLGDKLIENGIHDQVIFSNNGWQGKSLEELIKPPLFPYLVSSYHQLKNTYGRVDAILYHQGEINHSTKYGHEHYYNDFKTFINKLREAGIDIPIYLCRTSICDTEPDNTLIKVQNKIIHDFEIVKEGPNTDLLWERKYRLPDNCHFSMLGYERFSDMWVKSIEKK